MIKPTVGRVLLYRPKLSDPMFNLDVQEDTRYAAQIAFVHSDELVNLSVVDNLGRQFSRVNVTLAQDRSPLEGECEWMPYQKGQAAKTEELELKLARPGEASGLKGF